MSVEAAATIPHETVSPPQKAGVQAALWFLMLGNLVIGAGVIAPSSMMNAMAAEMRVSPVEIGALIGWGAVVLGVGAPTLAVLTGKIPRRPLLAACLLIYLAGHVASALAANYQAVLLARLLMIAAAAVYTPQAASAVSLMVPPDRRAAAVAFVFMGWPLANAVGSPALSLVSEAAGWRAGFWIIAAAAALGAAGVLATTPRKLFASPLSVSSWIEVLTRPSILVLLATTMVQMTGQFTLFAYLAAELKRAGGATPPQVAIALAVYGVAGIVGSIACTRVVGRIGAPATQVLCLVFMAAGLAAWAAVDHILVLAITAGFVWGLGFGGAVSMQQARLIAVAPMLASASVALNTSVLYVGQAFGATIGGRMIAGGAADYLGAAGAAFMTVAIGLSLWAWRGLKA